MTEKQYDEMTRMCEIHMAQVGEMMRDLKHTVYGNGRDGIKTIVEQHGYQLEQIERDRETMRKLFYGILGTLITTLILGVVSQFLTFTRAQALADKSNMAVIQNQEMLKDIQEALVSQELRN